MNENVLRPTRRGFLLGVASSTALFAVPLPTVTQKWAEASLVSNYGDLVVRLVAPASIGDPLPLPLGVPAWSPLALTLPYKEAGPAWGPLRPRMSASMSDFLNALEYGPLTLHGRLMPELLEWQREMQLCLPLYGGKSFITAMMIKHEPVDTLDEKDVVGRRRRQHLGRSNTSSHSQSH